MNDGGNRMTDYRAVTDALNEGADPAMLCATCPWDRTCLSPPAMTKADVDREMEKAKAHDNELADKARADGKEAGLPVGSLITILSVSGRDTQAAICPVFALRLRSSEGRDLVDSIRSRMTTWDDDAVTA